MPKHYFSLVNHNMSSDISSLFIKNVHGVLMSIYSDFKSGKRSFKDSLVNSCRADLFHLGKWLFCFCRNGINYVTFWLCSSITHSFYMLTEKEAAKTSSVTSSNR